MRKIKLRESELITIIKRAINESIINEGKKRKRKIEDDKYTMWCKEHGWEHGIGEGCVDDALDSEDVQIRSWAIGFILGMKEGKLPQKVIKEQKVFWPDDEGKPVAMERETSDDGNVPEVHRGMDIELIKPRVKDWWRGEEILWDMNVDYDKFDRNEDGVTFILQNKQVAFYDNNQKTLIIYKR